MAFFVPPSIMLVHAQFNLLFQFWIHTEVVGDLGPLEYILNTSNHHRVHHGSNRYCLDKNYAGVLIVWDRLFGTFEPIRNDEKLVYGLVDQPQYFNPLFHQVNIVLHPTIFHLIVIVIYTTVWILFQNLRKGMGHG